MTKTSKNCHEWDLLFEEVFFTFSLLLLRLLSLDRDLGPPVLMVSKESTIYVKLDVLWYHVTNRFSFRWTSLGGSFHEIWFSITSSPTEPIPNCQQLRNHLSLRFLSLLLDLDRFFLSSPILLKSHKIKCHTVRRTNKKLWLLRPKRCGALWCGSSSGARVQSCHNIFTEEKTSWKHGSSAHSDSAN